MPRPPNGLPDRFWAKLAPGPGGCWEWIGYRDPKGYGRFNVAGRSLYAHRLMLAAKLGRPIRHDREACHNCPRRDNPGCVNPLHLWEGTHQQNMLDGWQKWRRRCREHP